MNIRTRHYREALDERGSISLWLIMASFVMVLLVGLAVDLAGQVHAQQRARDTAAQAARAGGQQIQTAPAIGGTRLTVDTNAARAAALSYLETAGVDGAARVSGGDTLTVEVTDTYRPRFLGLIGLGDLSVTGTASARLIRNVGGNER